LAATDYQWPRYWFDREGPHAPVEGYLTRPGELSWLLSGEEGLRLPELSEEPCLVLLGEPELGKSTAVRQAVRELEANLDDDHEIVVRLDLASHDNAGLQGKLFGSEFWRAWLQGKTLHLFLDSFDATLLRNTSFHRLLIEELEAAGAAISRLRLRIVCRSAEWIPRLGDDLRRLFAPACPTWTGPLPREVVLAQLRRRDVALAAECEGLDPEVFLKEIASLGLQSLAAVPLTLEMLIEAARETGRLPRSRAELFEDAALRLVSEYDREQRYSEARATLSAGERLAVAQRVAAAAVISGRTTICTESSSRAPGELHPAEISGGSEEDPRADRRAGFEVTEKHILEVLRTALFVDFGPDRVRFRHRGLAEYLAARYLIRRRLDEAQRLSLLVAPGEEEEHLIPQLREVAAWMAAMDPTVLGEVLAREPDVVLRADRLHLAPEQAAVVVAALLTPDVAERYVHWSPRLARDLRAVVDHPGLADALRGPLGDRDAPESVRIMALTVARACERQDLEPELLAVALDSEARPVERAQAAAALGECGSDDARRKLIPLARDPIAEDRFLQVRGAALNAVFPGCLDLKEILAMLVEPSEPAPKSNYVIFLREILPARITPEDLPTALRWAAGVQPNRGVPDELNRLVNAILRQAWPRLHEPEIAELTVAVALRRLESGVELFGPGHVEMFDPHFGGDEEPFFEHAGSRRTLIRSLIERLGRTPDGRIASPAIEYISRELVRFEDRFWILDRLAEETGGPREAEWNWLAAPFSPQAERERAEREGAGEERDPRHPSEVAFDEAIEKALAQFERGDLDAWFWLIEAMRPGLRRERAVLFEEVVEEVDENEANLTEFPGWVRADPRTRERIVDAAAAFLEAAAPQGGRCLFVPDTLAGFFALFLLAGRPVRLDGLSAGTWARWAPVVLRRPMKPVSAEEDELDERLFATAAKRAPAELARWAAARADRVLAADGDLVYAFRELGGVRDPRLVEAVLPKLEGTTLSPQAHASALSWLIGRAPDRAVELAEPYLTPEAIAAGPEGRARAIGIAAILLKQLPAVGWPLAKRLLAEDEELGTAVLRDAAQDAPSLDPTDLPAPQLAELVETMFDLFPPGGPAPRESDDDEEARFAYGALEYRREKLLVTLAKRGADESVAVVEELRRRWPEAVPASLVRAATEARRFHANTVEPGYVVELCQASDARLVFDDRGLQEALLSSLRRIQASLRKGEPPLANELWNSETNRPELEDWLSNWLAERLRTDLKMGGRVINREVQVGLSASGKGRPKSTDLKVTAPTGKQREMAGTATVLIEAKGAWNRDLRTGMKGQLVEDYLRGSGQEHGIYLVYWFPTDDSDAPGKRGPWDGRMSFAEAEAYFAGQAEELSASGDVVVRAVVLDCSR